MVRVHPYRKIDRRLLAVTAVVFSMVAAGGCGSRGDKSTGSGSADQLTLGASLSLSGSLSREGGLTKEGYDLCTDVVNGKGGVAVGGKHLNLTIKYQDDKSVPDTAAQIVDKFNDDGVKLLLGPYGSANTAAAAAVVERSGQVMADSSGADDNIFAKGYTRTFAVLSPATTYAASMVSALNDLAAPKPKTIAFLSADDGFSKTVTEGGVAEAEKDGFTVVDTEYVPNGTADVSAALIKIKPKHPDVIMVSAHLAEGVATIKQSKELGVTPAGGFAETVAPPTPDFVKSLGKDAEGVLGSTQWTSASSGQDAIFGSAADYAKTFKAKFGREPEYHGAEATAACLALVLAVQHADSTDPGAVRTALAGLDEPTFFGTLKFTPQGENTSKPMGVVQIQNGAPVPVWPKESSTNAMTAPVKRQ